MGAFTAYGRWGDPVERRITEVLAIRQDEVAVLVNVDAAKDVGLIRDGTLELEESEGGGDVLKSSPGSRVVRIGRNPKQAEQLAQLAEAHAENIRLTAKTSGGLGRGVKSSHSDTAVMEIGRDLRRELPLPLYSYDQQPVEEGQPLGAMQVSMEQGVRSYRFGVSVIRKIA